MIDKQIIDKERMFECVWCKYDFKESDANFILSENPNKCVCSGCITEWADNLLCDFKRKTHECEELKKEIERKEENYQKLLNKSNKYIHNLVDENVKDISNLARQLNQLKSANEQAEQKLERIRAMFKESNNNSDEFYINGFVDEILQIVDEVE